MRHSTRRIARTRTCPDGLDVKKSNSQHKRQKTTGHPEKNLRELIKDEPRLHQLFDSIYDEVTAYPFCERMASQPVRQS